MKNLTPKRLQIGLLTLGGCLATGFSQQVVFTEVMYNPPAGKAEYVEIRNNMVSPWDLSLAKLEGGVEYRFPDFDPSAGAGNFLGAFETIIIASVAPEEFRKQYPNTPATARVWGPWQGTIGADGQRTGGFLSNSSERLTFRDKNGSIFSTFRYSDDTPWPSSPDGAGHSLHVVNSNRRIEAWKNWKASAFTGGSPGQAEPTDTKEKVSLSEVQFDDQGKLAWVELSSQATASVDLSKLAVATKLDLSDKRALSGSLAAGASIKIDLGLTPSTDGRVILLDQGNNVLTALKTTARPSDNWQAFPVGSEEWYLGELASPGVANKGPADTGIVINEIMYAPPIGHNGEYVELYNKGTSAVNVGGWTLSGGLDFVIPAGTTIPADGYLVIAADLETMKASYKGLANVLGNFAGGLGNDGDTVRLQRPNGNLADQVDYGVGGEWPWKSDDFGSSIELTNPALDNNRSSAWADSDESAKAATREYSVKQDYNGTGLFKYRASDQELHFFLIGEGHIVLTDIQFLRDGVNIIKNGQKQSTNGKSSDGWLCQGTHVFSYFKDGELHIISEGRGDNRANRVEIDTETIARGPIDMELKFKAKWIYGKPRLCAQTVDHGWSYEYLVDVPSNVGSPGARNSTYLANPPVQLDDLLHSPAVPKSTDTVTITTRVSSVDEIDKVQLAYAKDSSAARVVDSSAAPWARVPMSDDGTNGDAVAKDGIYSAQLTDASVKSGVTAFFVEALSKKGQRSTIVRDTTRPAMFVVDDKAITKKFRTMRYVISDYDVKSFGQAGFSAKYGFAHPAVSNWYRNTTIVVNESEVFYNCVIRSAGSPWHTGDRTNLGLKAKFKMPKSTAYRGRVKGTYDQDAGDPGRRHNDRLADYWLFLFGNPAPDHEFIWVGINGTAMALRDEVEWPGDNWFMNRHWQDGSNGQMFRVDDEWDFSDTWAQTQRDADWNFKNNGASGSGSVGTGERAGRYHSEYMLRSRELEYDYSSIIGMFRLLSGTEYTEDEARRVVDFEQNAMNFAVRGWIHDWDSPSLDRGKNAFIYRRPSDGRFFYIHWDSDLAYDSPTSFLTGKGSTFPRFVKKPYFQRIYFHYLNEILERYGQDSERLAAYFAAETEAAKSDTTVNVTKYNTWNKNRRNTAIAHLKPGREALFTISTNGGAALTVASDEPFTLEGTAPIDSLRIFIEGHPEATLTWTGLTTWKLSNIALKQGDNVLKVQGKRWNGDIVASTDTAARTASITVSKSVSSRPVALVDANPGSYNVSLGQEFELDASKSFDPEGDVLTYTWQGPAGAGYGLSTSGAKMKAAFDRPGLYAFTLTANDGKGGSTQITREAAVYGPEGFSGFSNLKLEPYWTAENLAPLGSIFQSAYYQLDDKPGMLMVQVSADSDKSVRGTAHPYLHRVLPEESDWSLQTRLLLASRQFGAFQAGLVVEIDQGGSTNRFVVGTKGGKELTAMQILSGVSPRELGAVPHLEESAAIRARRVSNQIHFEYQSRDAWLPIYSLTLDPGAKAKKGGLFVATEEAMQVRIGFDYVSLVSPGSVSSLQRDLRLTEIMYNPADGQQYEYLELHNAGSQALSLKDAEFTEGVSYKFGDISLPSGQYLVLAKDRVAFAAKYGAAVPLAPGNFEGQLANNGDTITLVDSQRQLVFSVTYNDRDAWPSKADGEGASLELKDTSGLLNAASNWQASAKNNGSPGKPAEPSVANPDDKDNDGMADSWETQYGLNPANPADAAQDADGDGWNNKNEFLAGTLPNNRQSLLRLAITRTTAGKMALNYPAVKGRDYTIEASNGLRTNEWSKLVDLKATADNPNVSAEDPTVAQRFYRLKVSLSQ